MTQAPTRDFSAFYDARPDAKQVSGIHGAHWRAGRDGGPDELVAVFRTSGLFNADGSERAQEIRFGALGRRRDLASAVVYGYYLVAENKTPPTRQSYGNFLKWFFAFLDDVDPACALTGIGQVDTALVNRYVAWLSTRRTGKGAAAKPMSKDYKESNYAQLKYAVEALRRDDRYRDRLATDCSFRPNPWPHTKGMGQRRGAAAPEKVLSDEHLRAIHDACRRERQEVLDRLDRGDALIAEAAPHVREVADLDLDDIGTCLAALERRYNGVIPRMERLKADDPALHAAVVAHGGRQEVGRMMVVTPRDLTPFIVLLAMRTFFNPDPLVSIRNSFCREAHWLWGGSSWEILSGDLSAAGQAELARLVADGASQETAVRSVLSSYKGRKGDMVSRTFRPSTEWDSPPQVVVDVRRATRRLRAVAAEVWDDRLFLFQVVARTPNSDAPRSFMSKKGPSSDGVLAWALKDFIRRHDLPRFNLGTFRLTGADIVWEATGGDPSAVAAMLGNDVRTARSHYDTPANVRRGEHRLAVMTNRRVRMVETKGSARLDFTACTPGFHCIDPYNSPLPGQREGHLCTAYPMCPGCPLGTADRSKADDIAWLLALDGAIVSAEATVEPGRYHDVYRPLLAALREKWLPRVPQAVRDEAAALLPHLPPIPELE